MHQPWGCGGSSATRNPRKHEAGRRKPKENGKKQAGHMTYYIDRHMGREPVHSNKVKRSLRYKYAIAGDAASFTLYIVGYG